MNELISVIVPVYNVENYLEKCLLSIVNQTYKNLEIICIDDGSPDNSIDILNKFAKKDNRVKVIRQKNKGLGATRNVGIRLAKGNYISFIDSDDWIENDMYENAMKIIKEKKVDIIDYSTFLNHSDVSYHLRDLSKISLKSKIKGNEYLKILIENNLLSVSACNKIFNLDLIKKNKIFFPEKRLSEDFLFTLKCFFKSENIERVTKPTYHYLIKREGSITNTINQNDISDVMLTIEEFNKFLKKEKIVVDIRLKEYIFLWINRAIVFKLVKFYPKDKEEVFKLIKNLKKKKLYSTYSKELFFSLNTRINFRIYILLFYLNMEIFMYFLKNNIERKENR